MQTDGKLPVNSKTWLITGASSGLGFALAQYVLEQGDCAVLGARNLRPMSELVAHYPDTGLALTLDVTRHEDRAAQLCRQRAALAASIEEQEERGWIVVELLNGIGHPVISYPGAFVHSRDDNGSISVHNRGLLVYPNREATSLLWKASQPQKP